MRILIATDGSTSARNAVAFVAARRWAPETVIRLVAVDDAYGEDRAELEAHLDEASAALRSTGLPVEATVIAGRAGSLLLADAKTWRADLVVAGCRGRGRIESLVCGSVSAELVERAHTSVLIARRTAADRLLVAVDGSPSAREVVPFLCASGGFTDGRALVVSVSREPASGPAALDPLGVARVAARASTQLLACGIRARREVLVGEPAATIIDRATSDQSDLIAVGSRGISGLRRLVLGSVARNVTFYAPCSVLVVRRPRQR